MLCFSAAILFAKMLLMEDRRKEKLGYDWIREAPIDKFVVRTIKLSSLAGFLGGFVGLGGGAILNPAWMEMGIPITRASASSNLCVMFTSLIATF